MQQMCGKTCPVVGPKHAKNLRDK